MPVVPDLLANNEQFASSFDQGDLPMPPAKHVAIVAAWTLVCIPRSSWISRSATPT
jgi:hypothetical protein